MGDPELLSWIEVGKNIAALLVAIGVAGEFLGDFAARPISRRIEGERQAEIARLSRDAADAKKGIAEANARAAEANQAAERERLARVELERKIAPRRLTGEQRAKMLRILERDTGHAVIFVSRLMDAEGADFANDFVSVLTAANWNAQSTPMHTGNQEGVSISTVSGARLPGISTLSTALDSIGILHNQTSRKPDDKTIPSGFLPEVIYLVIEHK